MSSPYSLLKIAQSFLPHLDCKHPFPHPAPPLPTRLTMSYPFSPSPHSSHSSSFTGSPRALLAQGLCTYCSLCQEHSSTHTHMALSLPPFRHLLRYPSSVSLCLITLILNSIANHCVPLVFFSENYSTDIVSYTDLALTR